MTKKFDTRSDAETWLTTQGFVRSPNEYIWNKAGRDAYVSLELGGRMPKVRVEVC